jgi:hypothetical protein
MTDFALVRPAENSVVGVYFEYSRPPIKDTFVSVALLEPDVHQSLEEVLLPYLSCCLTSVYVLNWLQAMGFS